MSQPLYGWRYSDGDIDPNFIEYLPSVVWRKRWEEMGQYENAGSALYPAAFKDFDHWAECMKKEGEGVVEVKIVEVKPKRKSKIRMKKNEKA